MTTSDIPNWEMNGELILNCNCDVFCPCVVSLGEHPPTAGRCHGWAGINIEDGFWGDTRLDGLVAGLMLDIPGSMGEGGWTAAAYVDERADAAQLAALSTILSGQAKGTTGILKLLVAEFLGVKQVPMSYERDGQVRRFKIPGIIDGAIEPIPGNTAGENVVMSNTQYWMGADVTISRAIKGKFRDFGRVWNLDGQSAELLQINWKGPMR